jgi:hypothetical protein
VKVPDGRNRFAGSPALRFTGFSDFQRMEKLVDDVSGLIWRLKESLKLP